MLRSILATASSPADAPALACAADDTPDQATAEEDELDVPVFSRTAGFRQDSITDLIAAVQRIDAHAASETEYDWPYDWPWYGGVVGAYFNGDPPRRTAPATVAGDSNPGTAGVPRRWERFDGRSSFRDHPAASVRVLAQPGASTYDPGSTATGDEHPVARCHAYDGGHAFYAGMGHTAVSFTEPEVLSHLFGGIEQVAGEARVNCEGER